MKSFAEALSTPEIGKLIAASLERDEKRSEEALRWLLGDEGYERMRRSVEVDQVMDHISSTSMPSIDPKFTHHWTPSPSEELEMQCRREHDRFIGVTTTPSPGSGWDPIGGRPISPDLEASATHGVGSTRTPGALDSMQVSPTVGSTNGELLDVHVTFDGSPGLELRLTARALHELVDFAGTKLGIRCSG